MLGWHIAKYVRMKRYVKKVMKRLNINDELKEILEE